MILIFFIYSQRIYEIDSDIHRKICNVLVLSIEQKKNTISTRIG